MSTTTSATATAATTVATTATIATAIAFVTTAVTAAIATAAVAAAVTSFAIATTIATAIATAIATTITTANSTTIIAAGGALFARLRLADDFIFKAFALVLKLVAFFAFKFVFEFLGLFSFRFGKLVGQTELFESPPAGELDAVAVIDIDHLDLHLITDVADIVDAADITAGQFADVAEPIAARQNLDKSAKVLDAADGAGVDLANLDRSRGQFHALQSLLGHGSVIGRNRDLSGIVDIDHGLGFFLNGADVLATRADQHANLFGVNLGHQQPRCVLRDILSRLGHGGQHLLEDLQPGVARLDERAANDVHFDPADLEIQLNPRNSIDRAGDLEIHVAVMVLVANDVSQQGPGIAFLDQAN